MKVTVYSRTEIEKVMADGNFPHFQIHPPGAVRTAFSMLLFYHFYAVLYSGGCFSFAESGVTYCYVYFLILL